MAVVLMTIGVMMLVGWVRKLIGVDEYADPGMHAFIGLIIGLILGSFVSVANPTMVTYTQEIVALADVQQLQGTVYLFGGTFQEEPAYCYYYERGENQYRQACVPADETTIFEDGGTEVVKHYAETQFGWGHVFNTRELIRVEVHVPNGTIVQNMVLDLE